MTTSSLSVRLGFLIRRFLPEMGAGLRFGRPLNRKDGLDYCRAVLILQSWMEAREWTRGALH